MAASSALVNALETGVGVTVGIAVSVALSAGEALFTGAAAGPEQAGMVKASRAVAANVPNADVFNFPPICSVCRYLVDS
jgi:hypothetical protein